MEGKHCGDCQHRKNVGKICLDCLDSGTKKNYKQLPEVVEVPAETIRPINLGGSNK